MKLITQMVVLVNVGLLYLRTIRVEKAFRDHSLCYQCMIHIIEGCKCVNYQIMKLHGVIV